MICSWQFNVIRKAYLIPPFISFISIDQGTLYKKQSFYK